MLKNLLFLAAFSLFVVIVFIATNIFLEKTSTTISPSTQQSLQPIEDTFNIEVLNELKGRSEIPVDLSTQSEIIMPEVTNTPSSKSAQSTTVTPKPVRGQ